ncbi:MAG: hypothetical protein GKR87_14610 [Kiritimatiellae bacterium]|nr:hypothetical protein [Kiritimatiellia bacterium]
MSSYKPVRSSTGTLREGLRTTHRRFRKSDQRSQVGYKGRSPQLPCLCRQSISSLLRPDPLDPHARVETLGSGDWAKARSSTLRFKLLKQAVRVRKSARRIWIQFGSGSLIKDLFAHVRNELAYIT